MKAPYFISTSSMHHATLFGLRFGRHFYARGKPQAAQDSLRNALYQSPTLKHFSCSAFQVLGSLLAAGALLLAAIACSRF